MKGLAPQTSAIFDSISKMDCIKPFVLVGGTALSMQLNHRMSEDLDFMKWMKSADEKQDVEWHVIRKRWKQSAVLSQWNFTALIW